jgi:hypothetical protein
MDRSEWGNLKAGDIVTRIDAGDNGDERPYGILCNGPYGDIWWDIDESKAYGHWYRTLEEARTAPELPENRAMFDAMSNYLLVESRNANCPRCESRAINFPDYLCEQCRYGS